MSRTLALLDAGWESVKAFATHSHSSVAVTCVENLLAHPNLPSPVAADARRLAAELLCELQSFPQARRHLCAAADLQPGHAHTHYLLGCAHEEDPQGEHRKAARRFRKAIELEPTSVLYRAAYARALVRCDRVKAGVRQLRAIESRDVAVVRVVVEGLLEAGCPVAARRTLAKAMFACPGSAVLKVLWERVRFERTAKEQRQTRRVQDATSATDGGVAVLPFIRVVRETDEAPNGGGTIRRDWSSRPQPHLPQLRVMRADR
jgi:tetratricopeptide (TPR) repeat protein